VQRLESCESSRVFKTLIQITQPPGDILTSGEFRHQTTSKASR